MAQLTGGPNNWTTFAANSVLTFIEAVRTALVAAGWELAEAVPATITGEFGPAASNFANGSTVSIDGHNYTFRTTLNNAVADQVALGPDLGTSLANLKAAINQEPGSGLLYSSPTPQNSTCLAAGTTATKITINAREGGPAGNGKNCHSSPGPGPFGGTWTVTDFGRSPTDTNSQMELGGYKLRAKSPQMLTILVYLYDFGSSDEGFGNPAARVKFLSDADPTVQGYRHFIRCPSSGRSFQIVASPTNFFISMPGVAVDPGFPSLRSGTSVCGGILKVDDPTSVTEAWFSFGDGLNANDSASSPRIALQTNGSNTTPNEGCWNGVLTNNITSGGHDGKGVARILAIASTDAVFFNSGPFAAPLWFDGTLLTYDPQMAWGDTPTSSTPTVRGTIYDARVQSEEAAMDTQVTDSDGSLWMNYTDQYPWGGLWLLIGKASAQSKQANLMY